MAGFAMFYGLNDDEIIQVDEIESEAKLIAFTKDAAILDGIDDNGSFSEHYHALEFVALTPEKIKNRNFVVWVSPTYEEGINDKDFWTSEIGNLYNLKVKTELIENDDYPCVFTCSRDHLKENKLTANKAVGVNFE